MITPIIRHELRQVLYKAKTWYCLAALQVLMALIFKWLITNYMHGQAISSVLHFGITEEVIHPFYAWFGLLSLVLLPMLTTQMICAEKQQGTIINYYCAPISGLQFMLGKFLSINILLLMLIAFISIMPLSIMLSGALDWGQYAASLFGVYLMLAAAIAIGLSLSAFMRNVIRANMLIFIAILGCILLEWAAQYMGAHALFLQNFGLLKPLKNFLAGIISLRSISYYCMLILGFIWLGSWGYARRWHV